MTHPVSQAIDDVIFNAIVNAPRSLQRQIGPSEIGTDCVRCLARKMLDIDKLAPESARDMPWLPFIGTAVHASLEEIFANDNDTKGKVRWLIETRLPIGTIGDMDISGSCDLFDKETGTVVDHKVVGLTKLKSLPRKGPGNTYRIQAHLYGYGWTKLGLEVKDVAVKFYPRNDISMTNGYFWYEKYDEQVAIKALERANEIYRQAIEAKEAGNLTEFLKICATSSECFSCHDYPTLDEPVDQIEDDMFSQPTRFHKR
jgi:DNA-binding XRE family transcriptional regulator